MTSPCTAQVDRDNVSRPNSGPLSRPQPGGTFARESRVMLSSNFNSSQDVFDDPLGSKVGKHGPPVEVSDHQSWQRIPKDRLKDRDREGMRERSLDTRKCRKMLCTSLRRWQLFAGLCRKTPRHQKALTHMSRPPLSSPCPSYQSNRSRPKSETKNAQRILPGWQLVSSGHAAKCPAKPGISLKFRETPARSLNKSPHPP